ncbi:mannosyltransferase [Cutaneotrichosporon oleaginosum]|uniref:GPI mannosyltransferase 2 n=1 Tax=Cutaneotrichosporon oleaginosum TaxID=879819 RepID=A0A0J0XX48_9TREE|nr:mannosyltransferase [Cutaneotrichosporon oleaginosum]KLT45652.1 mannosyltransferase [Cutaneotrichosporon oleaginosum]TXT04556.1 hypothetical protein COLE_07375 [Cutaneotrichosporon oleaginosum]
MKPTLGGHDVQNVAGLTLLTSLGYYAVQEVLARVVEPFDSSHLLASTAPGLRWDALHFLGIATKGYMYEQHLAFQPGWQALLNVLGDDANAILLRAAIVNIILRVGAAVLLYKLTRTLFNRRIALLTGVLYAFPPAPAPLSAPYTETTYSLATLAGFYAMATQRWFVAAAAFAAATSVRATGVFTTIPLAYAMLVPALRRGLTLSALPRVVFTGILCVIVVAPFVTFQAWTWAQFCYPEATRPWCSKLLPSSYSFVQGEYWNIGLFKYWRLQQAPNFLLAAPVLTVSLIGVCRHLSMGDSVSSASTSPDRISGGGSDVQTAIVVYIALMDVLLIFASHTQIALRLAPTDPVVWWTLAKSFDSAGSRKLTLLEKGWGWWVLVWGAASLVLWSGHYPPA